MTKLPSNEFWQSVEKKLPFVFKGERSSLFSLANLHHVFQTAELLKSDVYVVENEGGTFIKDYAVGHLNPEATWVEKMSEINEAFRKRYVVKIQGVEHWDRAMVQTCNALEEKVNGTVDAHLYLAPSNGGSFGLHTDPNDVFVHVLHGRKQFELPEHNLTVDLEPGDWLYIPKNAQHKGFSLTNSIMLSFGVRDYLADTLRVPLVVKWYSSLGNFQPSEEWCRKAAEMEEGVEDISAGG